MFQNVSRIRRRATLILFVLLAIGLFGCTQTAEPEVIREEVTRVVSETQTEVVEVTRVVSEVETRVVEVQVTPTPDPNPPQGGTLVFGTSLAAEFPINPIIATHRPGLWVFDPLLEFDPDTLEPSPNLAESWAVSDDGTVYTFTLREDVLWHDGEHFTADDVVFTFDAWLNDPNSIYRSHFVFGQDDEGNDREVEVEKIDDYTVEFTLPEPRASFLSNLTGWHGIAPQHLLEGEDLATTDFNQNPVGTGALKFVELQPQEFVRYEMNKDYWRGTPNLDGFIWRVMPDDDAQVTALSNGEIDVMKNVNTTDVAARVNEIPGVTTYRVLGHFTYAFYFNPEQFEPFQDQAVREAIALALDKPTIIEAVIGGDVPPAEQLLNPNHVGYNEDVRVIGYDPEAAVARLEEAGWTDSDGDGILDQNGEPLAFTVMSERADLPDAIQGYLREVGVDMSINIVERAVRRELQESGDWQAYIGWDGNEIPFNALVNNWTTEAWTNYDNPAVDELLIQADLSTDPEEQDRLIQEVEAILTDDVAGIWLHYYVSRFAVSDNIGGLQIPPTPADQNNTGVFYHLEDLYMLEPKE